MKIQVKLETEKMKEREVREHIEKATAHARSVAAQRGHGDVGHEKMRDAMIQNAERDRKDGKI